MKALSTSREFVEELLKEGYIIIKLEYKTPKKGESITWEFKTNKKRYLILTTIFQLKPEWVEYWAVQPDDEVERKIKLRFYGITAETSKIFTAKELEINKKELKKLISALPSEKEIFKK
jgi:heptaprenylglyceryl phosphate synthase